MGSDGLQVGIHCIKALVHTLNEPALHLHEIGLGGVPDPRPARPKALEILHKIGSDGVPGDVNSRVPCGFRGPSCSAGAWSSLPSGLPAIPSVQPN